MNRRTWLAATVAIIATPFDGEAVNAAGIPPHGSSWPVNVQYRDRRLTGCVTLKGGEMRVTFEPVT